MLEHELIPETYYVFRSEWSGQRFIIKGRMLREHFTYQSGKLAEHTELREATGAEILLYTDGPYVINYPDRVAPRTGQPRASEGGSR